MTWRWRALVLPLLALSSALLTTLHVLDLVASGARPSGCGMTYSWPVYTLLTHEWRRELRAHHKYALYSVHMQERREQLTGQPVLFLPGHLGSYKQARSLARHLWDHDAERFDVFALDFEEEWTGLHGALVERQAEFLNDAIRAILKQYKKQHQQRRQKNSKRSKTPDSVIVVAHSMGGVVARLAQRLPNYKRRSMPHIVTLGSPLARPAFPFDASLQRVYATLASTPAPDAASTVVVSIAGGHKDTTVHSSLSASASTSTTSELELSVLSSALPGVGLTIDHLCLLWCHQLLDRVAASLVAITDATTRQLERDPDARLQAAHATLLQLNASDDSTALDAELARHRDALRLGYHSDDEFAAYGTWLPRALVHVLRTRLLSLAWMMFVVVVHVLHLQLVFWQRRFDLETSSSASSAASSSAAATPLLALDDDDAVDAAAAGLPSFLTLLHPFNHVPPPLVHAVASVQQFVDARSSRRVSVLSTVVLPLVVVSIAALAELSRRYAAVHAVAMELLALVVLYAYALGALFALSHVLALLRAAVLRPVLRVARSIAHRARLPRWLGIALVLAVVQVLGHVRDFELLPLDVGARHLALLQLGAMVVVVLHVVELGVKTTPEMMLAQQRYRTTLFALLALSGVAWVGDAGYALDLVAFPPPTVSTALLGHVALRLALLALVRHWISRTDREMLPLPPTAFFDCSASSDDGDAASTQTITAANCPRCIFEDGGPGAIFIEYEHPRDTKRLRGRHGELVVVGPTFRVVACDCVVRFQDRRAAYCAFCTRACRLCGGGSGNWEQAQRAREFLEQSTTDRAMHGVVASSLELVALAMLTLWPSEHHVLHATAAIAVLLVIYHAALRHPVELERMKKAQRKREQHAKRKSTQQQKKKKNAKRTSSGTSGSASSNTTTTAPATAAAPAPVNTPSPVDAQEPSSTPSDSSSKSKKKKAKAKKKPSKDSTTTASASSFMDAYAASDLR